jgi:hypothetical protein
VPAGPLDIIIAVRPVTSALHSLGDPDRPARPRPARFDDAISFRRSHASPHAIAFCVVLARQTAAAASR